MRSIGSISVPNRFFRLRHFLVSRRNLCQLNTFGHSRRTQQPLQVLSVQFFLLHQPLGKLLEGPAGIIEGSETPEHCAGRELQEEIGYRAREMRSLGSFWTTPGFCDELMYVYLASDLAPSALDPDPDEFIETVKTSVSSISELIQRGEIQDAKTIAALLMAACVFDQA